ncbi:lytic transglycosylase domain-containing protein [Coprothermobacteraceae bacterium]|nr:lytic transglycosylase domain-containing protein [Coprothermobacteraceae bacterium]
MQLLSYLPILILILLILLLVWLPLSAAFSAVPLRLEKGKTCLLDREVVSWSTEVSRSEPFLVERMAMEAGASATVAFKVAQAYRACNPNNLPADVLVGVMKVESDMNPKEKSYAGARGLMQLLPSTFRIYADRYPHLFKKKDIYDPFENTCAGLLYLNDNYSAWASHVQDRKMAIDLAVASYLTGVGNLKNRGYAERIYENNNYVSYYLNRVLRSARNTIQAVVQ